MAKLILKDHQIEGELPSGISYSKSRLSFAANKEFIEPIIIEIKEDNNESLIIEVGRSTAVTIILEVSSEEEFDHNYNLKLIAEENTQVKYLLISELNSKNGFIHHTFEAKKDANLELMGGFVSNILKAKMTAKLLGKGANVHIRVVAISSTNNEQNIDIELIHQAPYSTGLMHNIAIANNNGKIILNGVEKIEQGMIKVDAYQSLKGIITSDDAVIEVNPILLIDEHDIKAGHGATVGKLDEHSIYYLMSRGLTKKEAEKLMINGLLSPLIDAITDQELKERFINLVNDRL